MSDWKEKLLPASFRDVPFFVASTDDTMGRRTIVHEYPSRNVPYVEDLGEVTRKISISAFCLGSDYLDQRDALSKALNTKGSATLIHPYYGSILVALSSPVSVQHTPENGGMCVFNLEFVRVEEKKDAFANASVNTVAQIESRSDTLLNSISDVLQSALKIASFGDYVKTSVEKYASKIINEISYLMGRYNFEDEFSANFYKDEDNIASSYVEGLSGSFDGESSISITSASSYTPEVIFPDKMGTSQRAVKESQKAFLDATKQVIFVFLLKSFVYYIPSTRNEGELLSRQVIELYDDIALNYCNDDNLLSQFEDLRIYALKALNSNMGKIPYIFSVSLSEVRPSLELSYTYLGNLSADDVADKNKFEHPGFIPANTAIELRKSEV